ncbi:MAG: transketolase [Dehalococcoidia bacterium]
MPNRPIDDLCINTIRTLAMDAVQQAGDGHPGTAMGVAPMAYTLWTRFLRYNPANPHWAGRDRFILSPGHAAILQYSLLHLTGFDLPMDELKRFRQWGSRTPGHPEYGHTAGIELTTGPLGSGFATGVGMAIAERFLAATFNRPGHEVTDHRIYGIVSDGDLMEGVASEAASLAGHLGLGKLIYLYDDNRITIDGHTDITFTEDVGARFEAYGWHVEHIEDQTDIEEIAAAIERARADLDRPSLIIVPTTIAYGSPHKANDPSAHGSPLGAEEVALTKQALGWPAEPPFFVPDEALAEFRLALDRGRDLETSWNAQVEAFEAAEPEVAAAWRSALDGTLPEGWAASIPAFGASDGALATRQASGKVLAGLTEVLPTLIGGSADLAGSTNAVLPGAGDQSAENHAGRNIHFGVREHAMGGIVNGLALHGGILPFSATFMMFSDYMRPQIRLGALQGVRAVYIFTHDSIGVGGDGPTHQPVEHLASLRAIPNVSVMRPADANETAACWQLALDRTEGPTVLALSRQSLPVIEDVERVRAGVPRGAYVLADAEGTPDVVLIATGSEVSLALETRALLGERGVQARVVSMPAWDRFEAQSEAYRAEVLPPDVPRVSIEAAASLGWERWVGTDGEIVAIDRFGASAPGGEVMKHYGFTAEAVAGRAVALVERRPRAVVSAGD